MKRISCPGILLAASGVVSGATLDHTGWFPFLMPWNDTARTVVDQSWSVEAPAGKHGFLQVDPQGRFRFENDPGRVRFSGFVQTSTSNFPDSVDAPLIAARLRKLGTNLLRVHLLDNDWGAAIYPDGDRTMLFDPQRLRRLDWFLKCLRDQGIYVNFCVQSGHVFRVGDSIPAPLPNDQAKIATIFDPRLVRLQQEWARMFAEHVNPYTGVAYKDDPAVATWELTNENQLFMAWLSWGSWNQWDSISATRPNGLHPYYVRELDSMWNAWLADRYTSDSVVEAAWRDTSAAAENKLANPSFEAGPLGWNWWADGATGADISVTRADGGIEGGKALAVEVLGQGAHDFDANVSRKGIVVESGKSYRFRFWAKGSERTSVRVEFLEDAVWTWFGEGTCAVDTVWTECVTSVVPPVSLDGSFRLQIDVGLSQGLILVDSTTFQEWAGEGLRAGESLQDRSIRRSSRSTLTGLSVGRVSDEARFYAHVESTYVSALGGFLKDSLGIRVPVTFTNNWYGLPSIASQAQADYMDAHWYWDHPSFPDGWSATDFTQNQKPMVSDPAGGTVAMFAASRVAGKPLVGSEYNHPWPNRYQCEAPAFYYGYLGFLDADGALLHAFHDGEAGFKSGAYRMFFNAGMDPLLLTQQHLARLFRMGAITPTPVWNTLDVTDSDLHASALRRDGSPFDGSLLSGLRTPTRWGRFDAATSSPTDFPDPGSRTTTSTGEFDWDRASGILRVDNPSWKGLVGFLSADPSVEGFGLQGMATTGGLDFAAIHLVPSDSLPLSASRRLLLLTSARMENPHTTWSTDFSHTTRMYTEADTMICEPVTGHVWMVPGGTDSTSVYPLDPTGRRKEAIPVFWSGDTLRFTLPGGTLWYEVAKGDASSPLAARGPVRSKARLGVVSTSDGFLLSVGGMVEPGDRLEWVVRSADGRVLSSGTADASRARTIRAPSASGVGFLEARWVGDGLVRDRVRAFAPLVR
ncbi:MAG: carbohydrate binding domain-containing protein [Fibrobacteria bacterium]|nr:carbohydrate binding domain-containing protein [Fibrobacteria bacterium]